MGTPKLKDITQKLSILRDFSSMLLPAVIGLIAVLLFIPTHLLSNRLDNRIENDSVSVGKKIASQIKNAVPSKQWEEEQKYQKAYAGDVNQIAFLAIQSTLRPLLSYKLFPNTEETSPLIFDGFGKEYCRGVEQMIVKVDGLDCPSQEEIDKSLKASESETRGSSKKTSTAWGGRSMFGSRNDAETAIIEELCLKKANTAAVYVNPSDISGYNVWMNYPYIGKDKGLEDCWYWQLGYWIIEDVFDTVKVMNAGSKSVFESAVKRIRSVSFASVSASYVRPRSSSTTLMRGGRLSSTKNVDIPSYVLSEEDGLTESLTVRVSDNEIDVVDFKVVAIIKADEVMHFMRELCSSKQHIFTGFSGNEEPKTYKHNQITILESAIRSLSRNSEDNELYRYGENAVVEVELVCEYIFNKSSYAGIEPEPVKQSVKELKDKLAEKVQPPVRARPSESKSKSKSKPKQDKFDVGI